MKKSLRGSGLYLLVLRGKFLDPPCHNKLTINDNHPIKSFSMAKIHPWPAAIIAYFSIVLCGVVVLVIYSLKHNVELVRSDYYAAEVKFQDQIERIKRTEPYKSEIGVDYALQHLEIRLPNAHTASGDFSGALWIYRPSNATLDQKLELNAKTSQDPYRLEMELAPGLWRIKVNWQAGGQEYFFEDSLVVEAI